MQIVGIHKPFSKKKEQENDCPKYICSPSTWKAKSEEWRGHDHLQIVYVYKVQVQPEVCNKTLIMLRAENVVQG